MEGIRGPEHDDELGPRATSSDRHQISEGSDESRQFIRSHVEQKRKEVRKKVGLPVSPDEEEELPEGVTVLYKIFDRRVTLHPGNIVMKTGNPLRLQEADALRIAEENGIPVPHVHEAGEDKGRNYIKMDYIEGETLAKLWPRLSVPAKDDIVQQLRGIVDSMRRVPPPPNLVGGCDGQQIHDLRAFMSYDAPACSNEAGFNDYLLESIVEHTPRPLYEAIKRRLMTSHRIVFSHGDIAPRNIIVKDGRIAALIDWENAGWYPEYWEYVKFFQRCAVDAKDWGDYADDIFSEKYPDELIDYRALSSCQAG